MNIKSLAVISTAAAVGSAYVIKLDRDMQAEAKKSDDKKFLYKNYTLIIPGDKLRMNRPSKVLCNRLAHAVIYLNKNPEAKCILSGGRATENRPAEAMIMRDVLLMCGIAPERMILEPFSWYTSENFTFSAMVIDKLGLSRNVVVMTDEFHRLRCRKEAEKNGLSPYFVSYSTPASCLPFYWSHEWISISLRKVLGRL